MILFRITPEQQQIVKALKSYTGENRSDAQPVSFSLYIIALYFSCGGR